MDATKNESGEEQPRGFESLLHQNEIAEKQAHENSPKLSVEERIRASAPPKREGGIVKTLRTFRGDIEENVSTGKTTLVDIASAQAREEAAQNAPLLQKENVQSIKKIALYAIGFLLIFSGIGGLIFVYVTRNETTPRLENLNDSFLIALDETITFDATNLTNEAFQKTVAQKISEGGRASYTSLTGIIPFKTVISEDGVTQTQLLPTEEFFNRTSLGLPSRLSRSLGENYLFGVHSHKSHQPFFVLPVTSYEIAYSAMLEWEESGNLEKKIGQFLRDPKEFAYISTTTASTSERVFAKRTFEDLVVKNIDVRVLKNEVGKILMLYAFPTEDTLVIVSDPEALSEIISHSTNRRVVR